MVEIEDLPDEPPCTAETEKGTTTAQEVDADGWQKLMGDDLVMKVIDKSPPKNSKESEPVKPQDAVLINFEGRIAKDRNDTEGPVFQTIQGWLVEVGGGDVLPSLEMGVRFMETGQTAQVWSHSKYAFGTGIRQYTVTEGNDKTIKTVPPNTNIMWTVTVTQIVMDTSRLNPYFTIQKALTRKNIANDIYQHEWCAPPQSPEDPSCATSMGRAIRLYKKAASDMETLLQGTYFKQVEEKHPQREQSQQVMLDSLNNIVAAHLKQKEYHAAKEAAVQVLQHFPKNAKALLRAAKAALLDPASTLEEVQAALKAAESEITYQTPTAEKELARLKQQFHTNKQRYKEQTKAMFGNKLNTKGKVGSTKEGDSKDDENNAGGSSQETLKRRKSVTFAPGSKEETPTERAPRDNGNTGFWKAQMLALFFQVGFPFLCYFFYRQFIQTNRVAEATLETNQVPAAGLEDL